LPDLLIVAYPSTKSSKIFHKIAALAVPALAFLVPPPGINKIVDIDTQGMFPAPPRRDSDDVPEIIAWLTRVVRLGAPQNLDRCGFVILVVDAELTPMN
jgi:hypothetical protein